MSALSSLLGWWNGFPGAFALTCLIELPAYLLAFSALGWCRPGPRGARPLTILTAVGVAWAVNLITHPMLWALALGLDSPVALLLAEVGVALVEGLVIFAVVVRRPGVDSAFHRLGWSLLAAVGVNAASLLVGLAVLPAVG